MDEQRASSTTNAALAERYDAIPYAAAPHAATHPDRLATIATFLGLAPPAPAQCRVLEVGCNDGSNLIPMAAGLPRARFVGCDLSSRALAVGRRTIADLGLHNITLVEEDLASLSAAHGGFDYIIAHGVYSWVPPPVRDALFALASGRLAPNGVMFVSFNALPGSHVRQAVWESLHYGVDHIADPRERLAEARRLARIFADGGRALHEADEALRSEFRAIAERSDSALFHDDLAVPNDPVYFHQFAAHAARFGLRYLAEAELHSMSAAGISPEARALLTPLDPAAREQYLDFVRLRRFRQALLFRADAPHDLSMHPLRLRAMHVAADPSLLRAAEAGRTVELARGLDPARDGGGPVRTLLDALIAAAPGAVAVAGLHELLADAALPRPVEAILTDAFVSSIVTLHVHPPPIARVPGERPTASPLARYQSLTREDVTSLTHTRVRLPDPSARRLLALCDGTRNRTALAAAMRDPARGLDGDAAGRFVAHGLEQFARLALLVG